MTNHERLIFWRAWNEMNAIRARDGAPQVIQWGPNGQAWAHDQVDKEYFSQIVDDMAEILGKDAAPWPPKPKDEA